MIKLTDRFWNKVDMGFYCWEWTGCKNPGGYGRFYYDGRGLMAHRLSWEARNGNIPEGLVMDHLCRNRLCVNPDHLEVVTNRENIIRGIGITAINSRKTQCSRGHEFNNKNTLVSKDGRKCRVCHRQMMRRIRSGKA